MNNRSRVLILLTIFYALLIFYPSSGSSPDSLIAILDFLENLENTLELESIEYPYLGFLLYPLSLLTGNFDKVQHIVIYAGFGFLLYFTLRNSSNPALRDHAFIFAVIIGTVYGAIDEFYQVFVPGRTASIWDLLADSIGLSIAQVVIFIGNKLLISSKRIRASTDLGLTAVLIILSILFISFPPFNQTPLRVILAPLFLLFLPGYLLISVMFPKHGELSPIERFTFSIGLSIAIFVFDGFALNYTPWGFRPKSIVISLSTIMGLLLVAAYLQRLRFKEEGYGLSFKDITSFYHTIRSKETKIIPEYDPALEKTLIKAMIIAILLVSAMLIYAKVTTREPEKFTALYILGADGKAENYTAEIRIGDTVTIPVGVENYEYAPVNYTLRVQLGGRTLKEYYIALGHEDKWLNNVTFVPQLVPSIAFAGGNRSKLEFLLLKDNQPYRSVHLLVNTRLDSVRFAELPDIINGNMASDDGWVFLGSPDITGNYNAINSSLRAYEINFAAKDAESYGIIYQNLTTSGNARAILSFDVRDSGYSNSPDYIFKQALINNRVIWESRIGDKNSSWEQVEIPVLLSGNNTVVFRVYNRYNTDYNVTVWWSNVQLKPYADGNKVESIARRVHEFKFDVRGAPLKLEKSIIIDGFNFPGFYYDINRNRSYEILRLEVSDNNLVDTGNATYTARVRGSELYIMGSRYRMIDDDPANLSEILETYPDKTLTSGKAWNFGNTYSLAVRMISPGGDSAMLELRKDGSILDSKLVGKKEIYEYRMKIEESYVTIFTAKVNNIRDDNVYLTSIVIYSDIITTLRPGTVIGDFEVANISSDRITLKNSYPIKLKDGAVILNGIMGLSIQGDTLYPYAADVRLRGTPQYINHGGWMNITGFNYPGFHLENGTSYEELSMYFSDNGLVEAGQAVYRSIRHSGLLSFLGGTYELVNQNKPGHISSVTTSRKIILHDDKVQELGDGFMITFNRANDSNGDIILYIRKAMTKEQKRLIESASESPLPDSYSSSMRDLYYEMYTGRKNNLRKSNILNIGDSFEYWIEYREDEKYRAITGELQAINSSSIELDIREYSAPFEITPGRSFGEFEVESVTSDAITLRNIKDLRFIQGDEIAILDGTLKIKTSSNEYLAYPVN
ncbi:putative membrane protein [Candidatus Methanoperedens nitroreducens]|uniref:Putative membrane protein n=1 Tax=Candidatus Methanoperedens nitratireducens TaxID=1392998 RepID=A0A062V6X3_9EURY|nr:VanZ family protein [Candidatus Methanoperedens nitroreducens]KCZ71155.1 putative membrane protein [Candidatus Methanoperedens nitroreducens]MDJ1421467.1 VanZ family protein [Candidatus Methanoperedens sp.]